MAFGDADLSVFTSDFGVQVLFGEYPPAQGNFDGPQKTFGAESGFGGVDVSIPSVALAFNAFPTMPVEEDTLTVDGLEYIVGAITAEGDGRFVRVTLKAVI